MALSFQFNKTESQRLQKQLKVRLVALPILKSKESSLRAEIQKLKREYRTVADEIVAEEAAQAPFRKLFIENKVNVSVNSVSLSSKKIAGVHIPVLDEVHFDTPTYTLFANPGWLPAGLEMLKQMARLKIRLAVAQRRIEILEWARRKTTQKVNLYEKVQIPELETAIRKIKRVIEDTENLERASQKIVKKRLQAEEDAAVKAREAS